MPCTSATVLRGRSRFGFLPLDMAALTPAAIADPTTAAAAEASMLFFFGCAAIRCLPADRSDMALAEADVLREAGALRAGLAARLAGFFADLRADLEADFRAVFRAEALLAVFLLACFFAFLAERAGFFRAMTNPFRLP